MFTRLCGSTLQRFALIPTVHVCKAVRNRFPTPKEKKKKEKEQERGLPGAISLVTAAISGTVVSGKSILYNTYERSVS